MTQGGEYDLTPDEPKEVQPGKPKPGEPGFVPPEVVIEKEEVTEPEPEEVPVDPDVQTHKGMAVAAYVLFLIPLLAAPNSKFARYHANQGLISFIVWWIAIVGVVALQVANLAVYWVVGERIWILTTFFSCLFHLLQPVLLVGAGALAVVGIIHAANGEQQPLPGVGHFQLIK